LNGSQQLTFQPDPSKSGLWVANAQANSSQHGSCQATHPLCAYTQDLFVDNVIQTPVATLQELQLGKWYFDRSQNEVYVSENPAGHTVELGLQPEAFLGSAVDVQISNLTIEKYANPAQFGALGGQTGPTRWIVKTVEVRWTHGAGVELGSGSSLSHSFIHNNGQLGVGMGGTGCTVANNEISWNNYAGYEVGWEAGGSKFWATTNLAVQSNYVHDNNGPGLWTDTDNVGTLYEGNTVTNNVNSGIQHEKSFSAIIRNNIVKGNGNHPGGWLWNAQISVQNSSNVEVYGNTVEVSAGGGNGIAIINQNRGSGNMGAYVAANNKVHNNTVTYMSATGFSGIVDDTKGNSAVGNSFNSDRFILKVGDAASKHWTWFSTVNWKGLIASGQEIQGSCCQ
jgi:hypothetical protein